MALTARDRGIRGRGTARCLAGQVELTVEHIVLHCVYLTNACEDYFCVTVTCKSELCMKVASHSIIDFIKLTGFYRKIVMHVFT